MDYRKEIKRLAAEMDAVILAHNYQPDEIQEIADILGHQSTESTPVYLKSSLKLLHECALSPEVE